MPLTSKKREIPLKRKWNDSSFAVMVMIDPVWTKGIACRYILRSCRVHPLSAGRCESVNIEYLDLFSLQVFYPGTYLVRQTLIIVKK